ncbi:RNA methyltransferase [Euhalothece natronophila Z-M001]|uniref:tRNA (cytidine/uridine-2'-O-)-methyltransferase TrmJ n=1 Tax=Euhalothece natronophila Z-M001 TaxID=522448 RepID=A0A5B8NP20_9CHRO|nr:RNA methyltransferase [Euhalothece natronophila]QDZ40696.1 RNA methyltransferase [Euhalothece natronophila Z-M001]
MTDSCLTQIRIVLVEPAGALNVGAIARVMKNMGLGQLILINPQCDPNSAEAKQMAVHGSDILGNAQIVTSLAEALVGCKLAVATTARDRALSLSLQSPTDVLPQLLNVPSALIFGREDSGLTNEELTHAQHSIYIPTASTYPSLNLATAVAICTYELQKLVTADSSTLPESPAQETVTLDALEGYYQHLEQLLLKIGFLYPHTASAKMKKFRQLFNRANLTPEELALLRGILRQTEWAIHNSDVVHEE